MFKPWSKPNLDKERELGLRKIFSVKFAMKKGKNYFFLPSKLDQKSSLTRTLTSTHLCYSPAGTELLVNMGGEHVYLFDKFRNNIFIIIMDRHNTLKLFYYLQTVKLKKMENQKMYSTMNKR